MANHQGVLLYSAIYSLTDAFDVVQILSFGHGRNNEQGIAAYTIISMSGIHPLVTLTSAPARPSQGGEDSRGFAALAREATVCFMAAVARKKVGDTIDRLLVRPSRLEFVQDPSSSRFQPERFLFLCLLDTHSVDTHSCEGHPFIY